MQVHITNACTIAVQVLGFLVRVLCRWHSDSIAAYAVQACLIVVAPVLYSASIYMVLGRLVSSIHGDDLSLIHPSKMSKIFIWADFVTLNVQANGAGITANKDLAKPGQYIVIAGLVLHLLVFGCFLILVTVFHVRINCQLDVQDAVTHPNEISEAQATIPWRQGLLMLYICSVLIMARSIFRIAEYIMGVDGVISIISLFQIGKVS
jgi:hypothetical protein